VGLGTGELSCQCSEHTLLHTSSNTLALAGLCCVAKSVRIGSNAGARS